MKNLIFILALLFSAAAFALCPANVPSGVTTCYYIDFAGGADTNAGTSTGAAWQHSPGMTGAKTSASAQAGWVAPVDCTIASVTYTLNVAGTLDSGANHITFSLDKNAGTALADTSDATHMASNAALSQTTLTVSDALSAGDVIRLKLVTPVTFGTLPTTVLYSAELLCQ